MKYFRIECYSKTNQDRVTGHRGTEYVAAESEEKAVEIVSKVVRHAKYEVHEITKEQMSENIPGGII